MKPRKANDAVEKTDSGSREAGAALLLLLPTLLVAYLARPGEHVLATWLLFYTRLVLGLVGVCSFLAAAMLAAGYRGSTLHDAWLILAWAATACASVLTAGAIWPTGRPREKKRPDWTDTGATVGGQ